MDIESPYVSILSLLSNIAARYAFSKCCSFEQDAEEEEEEVGPEVEEGEQAVELVVERAAACSPQAPLLPLGYLGPQANHKTHSANPPSSTDLGHRCSPLRT